MHQWHIPLAAPYDSRGPLAGLNGSIFNLPLAAADTTPMAIAGDTSCLQWSSAYHRAQCNAAHPPRCCTVTGKLGTEQSISYDGRWRWVMADSVLRFTGGEGEAR